MTANWRLALAQISAWIDTLNHKIGRTAAWLALAMVLVQFSVVVLRYVFGIGSILLQESILYMHGVLFMMAAADTFLQDAHVRVDIFYAQASQKRKALIDMLGCLCLILPFCILLFAVSLDYVSLSWSVREGSRETSGIQGVYLLKSVILVFAVQMGLQALSGIFKNATLVFAKPKAVGQ
ncbi:MAG: TRAP transporter small permease subunit [Rhodobiaceae bacterium]|jgi:TRAP-type mannitol/chloroaromatic compound transport system permease small subunit|nr:TRAP transporter small permease subunit [Rhodobiaceae bacterium]MBT5517335.1 TRAP transporter small permease subunit [Rhodobiaceae bacterium]MDG2494934.1 TRAP transporter small permease subunit [Alphaproteobacteria bacterium]